MSSKNPLAPQNASSVSAEDAPSKSKTAAPVAELSVEEEVRQNLRIKSKGRRPEMATGMSQLFDMTLVDPNYAAGGQLVGRMVNKDPGRLAVMRAKGYHMPQELSSRLKEYDLGNCTLMLQRREDFEASQQARREKINSMDAEAAPEFSPEYAKFKDHIDHRHTGRAQGKARFEVNEKNEIQNAVVTAD